MTQYRECMERDFKRKFRNAYPYIVCTDDTIVEAHEFCEGLSGEYLDLMKDYILSNKLMEDVIL